MNDPLQPDLRAHSFLGLTQSLCPECLEVVQAKIVSRDGRVWFHKHCPQHGMRNDFVCSNADWFDRMEFNVPGREPVRYGVQPDRGCPYDCGLCSQHEQHTCIAVLEITQSCNLTCPMCYAASGPGGAHLTVAQCRQAIDRLVECEGQPEILQLSGGEPTVHPRFLEIFEYACDQPIDLVMVNTNGIRIASDRRLCERLAERKSRCHVYLQMDGLEESVDPVLRGRSLLETKLRAVERLGEFGIPTTLVTTLQTDVNLDQIGPLIEFAQRRRWINGVSFQPATYVGRWVAPVALERRITFPDVIRQVDRQTAGQFRASDFFPIPCAHPNAHTLCYAYRMGEAVIPITRFVDLASHFDLLANGISFTREGAQAIIQAYLERNACGPGCDCSTSGQGFDWTRAARGADRLPIIPPGEGRALAEPGRDGNPDAGESARESGRDTALPSEADLAALAELAQSFFSGVVSQQLSSSDMFRITTTSFMDAYNFDLRQLMKSCVHHLLPSGHLIPFDAYNVLYRNGHVPLPRLAVEPTMGAGP